VDAYSQLQLDAGFNLKISSLRGYNFDAIRPSTMTPLERFESLIRAAGADGHSGPNPKAMIPVSLAWEILQLAKIGAGPLPAKVVRLRPAPKDEV
jgi:hypothetical protein